MNKFTKTILGLAMVLSLVTQASASGEADAGSEVHARYAGLEFASAVRGVDSSGNAMSVWVHVWGKGSALLADKTTEGLFDDESLLYAVSLTEEDDRDCHALVRQEEAIAEGAKRAVLTLEDSDGFILATLPCVTVETPLAAAPGLLTVGDASARGISWGSLAEEQIPGFTRMAPVPPAEEDE